MVGLGETVLKRRSKTVEQNLRELARDLVGRDPLGPESHHERMYRDSFWVGGPLRQEGKRIYFARELPG